MSKQVGKGDVFTRDSLRIIQDKMRTLCIASFNKEYGLNNILKKKEKGRNKDINFKAYYYLFLCTNYIKSFNLIIVH